MSNIKSLQAARKAKNDDISLLAGYLLEALERIEELEIVVKELQDGSE